jgi:hypothetical protein
MTAPKRKAPKPKPRKAPAAKPVAAVTLVPQPIIPPEPISLGRRVWNWLSGH